MKLNITRGIVQLDKEDLLLVSPYNWYVAKNGYAVAQIDGKPEYMHRLIMGRPKGMEIDHKSGDLLDNRKSRLRVCTHKNNQQNMRLGRGNTSGYKGVSLHKATGRFAAYICPNGRKVHLGYFKTAKEAAKQYDIKAKEYFGEFARLNHA